MHAQLTASQAQTPLACLPLAHNITTSDIQPFTPSHLTSADALILLIRPRYAYGAIDLQLATYDYFIPYTALYPRRYS
jgi:hypothetical protein